MSLTGNLEVTLNGDETITIPGEEFSWEEGGERDSRFMMKYSDPDHRFDVIVEFETEGNQAFNWTLTANTPEVKILDDELEVPDRFLNYDPDTF